MCALYVLCVLCTVNFEMMSSDRLIIVFAMCVFSCRLVLLAAGLYIIKSRSAIICYSAAVKVNFPPPRIEKGDLVHYDSRRVSSNVVVVIVTMHGDSCFVDARICSCSLRPCIMAGLR